MTSHDKEKYLKIALKLIGIIFLLLYPLGMVWPSGWVWHGGGGGYYLQMICGLYFVLGIYLFKASKNPAEHASLISFTIWSSIVRGVIMTVLALMDEYEMGHMTGDVPLFFLVAVVLWYLTPKKVT